FIVGIAPSVCLHIYRFLRFGSPIYPVQFRFLGIVSRTGFPLSIILGDRHGSGLLAPTWHGLCLSFIRGWVWPYRLPMAFFDSRALGGGFLLWMSLLTLPILRKKINRDVGFVLLLLIVTSFIVQDFWLPRYSTSLDLVILICVGGALADLSVRGRR